jgi:hypothetical protein
MTTTEVEKHAPLEVSPVPPPEPETGVGRMICLAIEKGLAPDQLERLFSLYEREKASRAKEEFYSDLARFQAECPAIRKTGKSMQFKRPSRDGGTEYADFLELDYIADTIRPHLHKYGFSYSWDKSHGEAKDGMMAIMCHLRHRNGHVESSSFPCPIGSNAGASEQQKYAAAATYAKRYSLMAALGLTGTSRDTDGYVPENGNAAENGGAEFATPTGCITDRQANDIEILIEQSGANREAFLKYCGAECVEEIPTGRFMEAVALLQAKMKRRLASKSSISSGRTS